MLLLIDKPKDMTSHDVVSVVRKKTGEKRVGHAGTLDPNATGLLIVGVGRQDTKKLGVIAKDTTKTYIAEIVLGEERDTDDVIGKVTKTAKDYKVPTQKDVEFALFNLLGTKEQIPPQYSAIKKNGQKAYNQARKGIHVSFEPRLITIYKADLMYYRYPVIRAIFEVSSGTYIRSIARDLGLKLGNFAYLNNLRRTKIGDFKIEDAKQLGEL